ncbi:hypothetical protein [Sphingomonas sp.]|uniref:hypothetical protein n=1 Tax=Sphingomonas sp. TaxID=28214 RepID=UPI003B3A610B
MTRIGMNLTTLAYWFPDHPYIDRAYLTPPWQAKIGYLQCSIPIPAGRTEIVVEWGGADSMTPQVPVAGKIDKPPVEVIDARTFRFTAPEGPENRAAMFVARGSGLSVSNPPSLSVVEAEHYAAWKAGAKFDPRLIADLTGIPTFRLKDWLNTDGNTGWQRMPLVDAIGFAEECGARVWGNIRPELTDTQIRAELGIYEALCSQTPIIEYGNELWNTSYPATNAIATRAAAAGVSLFRQGGREAARLGRFARGRRVALAAGSQPVSPSRGLEFLGGLSDAGSGPADFTYWTTSIYPYGTLVNANGPLLALARANDIPGAIANIMGQTGATSEGLSLAALAKTNAQQAQIAADNGLTMAVYEMNAHLHLSAHPAAVQAELLDFITRLQRDPRAAVIAQGIHAQARAIGAEEACWFAWSAPPTKAGYFSVKGTAAEPVVRAEQAGAG